MHSGATEVHVTLKKVENELELKVRDNGRGITLEEIEDSDSLGILGMQERTRNLGGKFRIHGIEGKGTSVNVAIPVKS
jgi:signal transduction histidine kinase